MLDVRPRIERAVVLPVITVLLAGCGVTAAPDRLLPRATSRRRRDRDPLRHGRGGRRGPAGGGRARRSRRARGPHDRRARGLELRGDVVEWIDGVLWLAAADRLIRVDPATGSDAEVALPAGVRPRAITSGFGSLWVTSTATDETPVTATGELLRLDPSDGQVRARIALGDATAVADTPAAVTHAPWDIAVGADRVWVELAGEGRVAGIDPTVDDVAMVVDLGDPPSTGPSPSAIGRCRPVMAAAALWASCGERMLQVDPRSGRVVTSVEAPFGDGALVSGGTVTQRGDVWFGHAQRPVTVQVPSVPDSS